jgi:hypothetical protein
MEAVGNGEPIGKNPGTSAESCIKELIEKNISLAYAGSARLRPPATYSREEWESEALFVLVRACRQYRPETGWKLSTYFWAALIRHRCRLNQFHRAKCRDYRKERGLKILVKSGRTIEIEDKPELQDFSEEISNRLNKLEMDISSNPRWLALFRGRRAGRSFADMAGEFGTTKQNLEQIWKRIVEKISGNPGRKTLRRKTGNG